MLRVVDMIKFLFVGVMFFVESCIGIGYIVCMFGGVNYEFKGFKGCIKGFVVCGVVYLLFCY